jgi:DNA-binding CsgD family transcriptional regulator
MAVNGKSANGQLPKGKSANGKRARAALQSRARALLPDGHPPFAPNGKAAPNLSARERDCLVYVAQGMNDADIAAKLAIAQSTAHFYVEKAKRKLGAKTRAQAVAHLIAAGLYENF